MFLLMTYIWNGQYLHNPFVSMVLHSLKTFHSHIHLLQNLSPHAQLVTHALLVKLDILWHIVSFTLGDCCSTESSELAHHACVRLVPLYLNFIPFSDFFTMCLFSLFMSILKAHINSSSIIHLGSEPLVLSIYRAFLEAKSSTSFKY